MNVGVHTTQNILIEYPAASVGDRILAYLLDILICVVYAITIVAFFVSIDVRAPWLWIIILGVPIVFYHLLFEIFMNGQSPGKTALDIKVMKLDGSQPSIGDYLLRWLLSLVDVQLFSGLIAIIVIAAGGKGQRLGDLAAGTTVIKLIPRKHSDAQEVFVPREENYVPQFPQVIQLEEKDIELIRRALEVNRDDGNPRPVLAVTDRLQSLLGIQTDLPPVKFLYTVIKDYQHLTSR